MPGQASTAGVGGANVRVAALLPLDGGIVGAGRADAVGATPDGAAIPTKYNGNASTRAALSVNASQVSSVTWGSARAVGAAAVLGRFAAPQLRGWEAAKDDCAAGSFSTFSGIGFSCTACPAGTMSAFPNAPSCTKCGLGRYNGATKRTACQKCAAGRASTATGATSSNDCAPCPAGLYSDTAGAACGPCEAGRYGSAAATVCTKCTNGKYNPLAGGNSASNCTLCPAGRKGKGGSGAASLSAGCGNCGAGYYSGAGATVCTACPKGRASASATASSLAACAARPQHSPRPALC